MEAIRKAARERIGSRCRVCAHCDGRTCAGEVPGMGGIGSGAAFRNNVTALAAYRLNMRVLHGANTPDPSSTLFGQKLSLPVLAAPIGSIRINLGSDMGDDQYADHLIRGCVEAGTMACVGDTPDPATYRQALDQVRGDGQWVIPVIKPWDPDLAAQRMDMAVQAGCRILGMDVDAAGLPILRKLENPVATATPDRLAKYVSLAHERGCRFIVKGVMTVTDALIAADCGADAVLVSNHGGRVLDHTPGTAEVLPAIAEVVGKRCAVLVDGGIRTGVDVLKVLALGADAALVCRPMAVAVHGGEAAGVVRYLSTLRDEFVQAMQLTGCVDVAAIGRQVLC